MTTFQEEVDTMAKGKIVRRRPQGGDKPKLDKKGHLKPNKKSK
jgi:hypothetical protein